MSNRILLCMGTCFLLLFSTSLYGQEDNTWTLEECFEYARKTNITLKRTRLQQQVAEINYNQAKEARMPSLGGNTSWNTNFGRSVNPFTNDFETQTINSLNLGVGGNVTLFNGFRITNSIKSNDLQRQAAQYDVEDADNNLGLNIATAYLNILLNQELLEGFELQYASTEEQRNRTDKLVEAGNLAPASLYEIEAQLATDQTNIVTTRNQLELAYLQLMQLMDLDPNQPFRVAEPELDDELEAIHPAIPDDIYKFAEGTQANVLAADLRVKVAEKEIAVARAGAVPSLSLGYNAGSGYVRRENSPVEIGLGEQLDNNFSYGFNFGLNIPIYSRRQIRSSIERSQINHKDAEMQADFQRQQLRQTIEQAHLDAVAAYSQYEQVKRQINSLETAFTNAEKQFNVGLINSVDYLLAKNNLDRAKMDLVRQKYSYIFRTKVLDFYQGNPLGF